MHPNLRMMIQYTEEVNNLLFRMVYYLFVNKDSEKGNRIAEMLSLYTKIPAFSHYPRLINIVKLAYSEENLNFNNMSLEEADFYSKLVAIRYLDFSDLKKSELPTYAKVYSLRKKFGFEHLFEDILEGDLDINALEIIPEETYLHYLGALYRSQDFKFLIEEYCSNHLSSITVGKEIKNIISPETKNNSEVGIRFLLLPTEKNVILALNLHNKPTLYGYLESTSLHLNKLALNISFDNPYNEMWDVFHAINPSSTFHNPDYRSFPMGLLWDFTFGSKILDVFDEKKEIETEFRGQSLHEIFQRFNIKTIKLIPSAWLYSLPLSAAFSRKENQFSAYNGLH